MQARRLSNIHIRPEISFNEGIFRTNLREMAEDAQRSLPLLPWDFGRDNYIGCPPSPPDWEWERERVSLHFGTAQDFIRIANAGRLPI